MLLPHRVDINNLFDFVPNFLPGVIAYVRFQKRASLPAWGFVILLFMAAATYVQRPGRSMGWLCCLTVGVALPLFRQTAMPWIVKSVRVIARYSYGIYLLHMWAIVIGFYCLHLHSLTAKLFVEAISLAVLAPAAYHMVEGPLIRLGSRLANRVAPTAGLRIRPEMDPVP